MVSTTSPSISSSTSSSYASPSSFSKRTFSSHTKAMSSKPQPQFSASVTNVPATAAKLDALLGASWVLTATGEGIEKSFQFKTFTKTWDFMTAISLQCKLQNHHPEWSNVYNTTFIRWTTHDSKGISEKDVNLAALCDSLAKDFGEITQDTANGTVKNLADKASTGAGDCCIPKTPKK